MNCGDVKATRYATQGIYQPYSNTPSTLAPGVPARYNQLKLSTAQLQAAAARRDEAQRRYQHYAQAGRGSFC